MSAADTSYMKEKPVLSLLLSMGIPMMLSMLINSLYNIVDGIFVARMSEDAMMAISLVYPVQNLLHSIAVGFGVGTNAVIAIFLGSRKSDAASSVASQGILLNLCHGLVFMVFGILFMRPFLNMFTSNETVIAYGMQYGIIVLCFSMIHSTELSFEKIFQSVGRMKTSMISLGSSCMINIILDPLLIFGIGPFPEMGIRGAALATGIGQTTGLCIYLLTSRIKPLNLQFKMQYFKPDKNICRRLYGIGIPATLNMALPSFLISALNILLGTFSDTQVLVLGIYYKLQSFLYLPANGMIQGMRPIMSYNYGARESSRVRSIYQTALCIIILILLAGTVLCLAVPDQLIHLFSDNTETIAAGRQALRIICIGFAVSGVSVVTAGALEAMGKGIHSLLISCMRYIVLILPLAFIFSHFFGVNGVWHAFWITEVITAVTSGLIFYRQYRAIA
ncbi:MAG: MATE family efflux transporter [Coprococcus sp.]